MFSPMNDGTRSGRNLLTMHSPSTVPANGAPRTVADLTSPVGRKVAVTCAVPLGLDAPRQDAARFAPRDIALAIAFSVACCAAGSGAELAVGGALALSIGAGVGSTRGSGGATSRRVAGCDVDAGRATGSGQIICRASTMAVGALAGALQRPTANPTAAAARTHAAATIHCSKDGT